MSVEARRHRRSPSSARTASKTSASNVPSAVPFISQHATREDGDVRENRDLGRFGSLDVVPLVRIDSGTTLSLVAASVPLSSVQLARNPGYAQLPSGGLQTCSSASGEWKRSRDSR